ncbi:hypothetical protein QWJ34_04735 [Saccharibacillus sp. CPCC 101409]|uniref:hypothetical protein n=1 Tax=Saccharibacillus sp. CPCC 101409 TaxID=3058041 RepID=UPI0026727621|nr:hypothetical protein [Saccharibacillus sp. CPCC 101409]MDO3409060.1 hypothetical protein [Saccharibacillus sp. CPCC 101409]
MKKKIGWSAAAALLLLLTIWTGYAAFRMNEKPVEYTFDIHTEDLDLRGVALVKMGGSLYVSPNSYLFSDSSGEHRFSEAAARLSIDGQNVLDTSSSDPFLHSLGGGRTFQSDSHAISGGVIHENLRISDRSKVKVEITYTMDGRSQSYSREFRLSDYRTPFTGAATRIVTLDMVESEG